MEEVPEEVVQEVADAHDAQEVTPDAQEVTPDAPVDAPAPAAPVKRPRGRPRKNPEEPKRPRGRPRKTPEAKEVRFEEPEQPAEPEPPSVPDAMYVLAQVLLQNEAEARRRKAERYKNMLGL
jgi:hypothetical protein